MHGLVLAIDQGTTNTKSLLVDRRGRPVFRTSNPVSLLTPKPAFVEQDPELLWNSVVLALRACVDHVGSGAIEAIAISNQRETALAWHRSGGYALTNAISWQCRRSEESCADVAMFSQMFRDKSGLPLDPLVSASKWKWLLDHSPSLKQLATSGELCLGNVDSWLIYKLTNGAVHATDHTNASRTGLLSLEALRWDEELAQLFGIPMNALPEVKLTSGVFGAVTSIPELAGIPIAAVIGDSHAALVGHGKYAPGMIKATYGTGSSLMSLTKGIPQPTKSLARTIAWSSSHGVQYALEGNVTMTGSGVQWVGEFLGFAKPVEDTIALAQTVEHTEGVYFVPAMAGLGAPYWDSATRGILTGLSRSSKPAHMARAAVEAIAYQVADVFYEMCHASGIDFRALNSDGGATRNSDLMQFQADLLRVPVHQSSCEELSALGAAWLGGLAIGWWNQLSDLETLPEPSATFLPQSQVDAKYEGWRLAVAQARGKEATA